MPDGQEGRKQVLGGPPSLAAAWLGPTAASCPRQGQGPPLHASPQGSPGDGYPGTHELLEGVRRRSHRRKGFEGVPGNGCHRPRMAKGDPSNRGRNPTGALVSGDWGPLVG